MGGAGLGVVAVVVVGVVVLVVVVAAALVEVFCEEPAQPAAATAASEMVINARFMGPAPVLSVDAFRSQVTRHFAGPFDAAAPASRHDPRARKVAGFVARLGPEHARAGAA